ncbi:related to COT1-Vacuolar zinc (and possibly other metals) transporter [Armillaria ostoyae]|uniref:Related to COT1-Vacuolar zinc (And possibly other metals) transporter n=1 Tax=Armillaria ostoyae TaxID=47428 RepID=A0A284RA83_ARMOS|nr:related to COT1-Vacuolar zinc (and possibly other metals) transporter [Armillaria ostoyae]
MGVSRSAKITTLLVIDIAFFFVELIVGYAVGSLALVADSFHMLNDVMSLVVALYAIKLTAQTDTDSRYSYGWHRAEILAALRLSDSSALQASATSIPLDTYVDNEASAEISNPRLVVIVGSLGLASNVLGLFLFHEYGHSHDTPPLPTPSGTLVEPGDVTPTQKVVIPRSRSRSQSQDSFSSMYGHPAATRASLVKTAQEIAARSPSPTRARRTSSLSRTLDTASLPSGNARVLTPDLATEDDLETPSFSGEATPLLSHTHQHPGVSSSNQHDNQHSHGHSHGSMNMRALVLHVVGDALGNVGVIATGLIIWLTSWSFKYYFDPIISLVITVIIFSSALPLVRSASFILLQGVPSTISLDEVRDSILDVDGVLSLHELHVWQLSETKVIASVHVLASRNHDFMPVAAKIRKALHHHGIHSSTIQPEYLKQSGPEELYKTTASCLIMCPPDQECDPQENACCPPPVGEV